MARFSRPAISIHSDDGPLAVNDTDISSDFCTQDHSISSSNENHSPPNFYRTSLSSLPQSSLPSEESEAEQTYTPTKKRSNTPRQISTPSRSRYSSTLSPRPVRGARIRTSPRPRTKERQEEQDRSTLPLVLLHITLLPVQLPWRVETMRKVLPEEVLDRLHLLRDRVCSAVLNRGVLICHPEEEIEVLEERLVEALGLEDGIVDGGSGDGREKSEFDGYESESEGDAGDSGFGSVDGDGDERDVKSRSGCHQGSSPKWEIKVFAANGLMRANTWASAWNEMERVDVEIAPFIPEGLRRQLDALRDEDEVTYRMQEEEELLRDLEKREEALQEATKAHQKKDAELERRIDLENQLRMLRAKTQHIVPAEQPRLVSNTQAENKGDDREKKNDLPPAYRPKDIPLNVLLRNYFYLLAQDRRNIVIAFLAAVTIFLSLRTLNPHPLASNGGLQVHNVANTSTVPQVFMVQERQPNNSEYTGSRMPTVMVDAVHNMTKEGPAEPTTDSEDETSGFLDTYIGHSDVGMLEE